MTATTTTTDDPYIWLEDVHGQRAMAWVEMENARSLAVLKGDPRYETFHQDALTIVNATDRIPAPDLIGTTVYNFWQDADWPALGDHWGISLEELIAGTQTDIKASLGDLEGFANQLIAKRK